MLSTVSTPAVAARVPLVVDLDGTLVATDTLWELTISFLKRYPWRIPWLIGWALAGKAHYKQQLAKAAVLDVESLPYREDCLDWLRAERQAGRKIWLATGADARVADAVANHLRLFDGVISSDGAFNATGGNKAHLIARLIGTQEYEYAGNAMADVAVWTKASGAIVVAPDRGVVRALKQQNILITQLFPGRAGTLRVWLEALRVHQWVKNLLVFIPLVTSHRIFERAGLAHAVLGFVIFGLVASSTYLINDLFDLPADRRHPRKSKRALASGAIALPSALAAIVLLLVAAGGLSLLLPWQAAVLVLGYSITSLLYSAAIKKLLMADVVALAVFYVARLLYGGLVTGIEISIWTLAFCAFAFFSLAAAKRINDLARTSLRASESLRHRAYQAQDANALVALSAATSNIAVLVLILYLNSQQGEKLYRHPQFLWAMSIPLLYWFSRILALANRGALADDPILFASKDKATYLVVAVMAVIAIVAT